MSPRTKSVLTYLIALLGAPLVVLALGFWILLIPLFAIYFGGIPYLLLAGPGFALALRHVQPRVLTFAMLGMALNLLSPLFFYTVYRLIDYPVDWTSIRVFWTYGIVFSALWGAAFALLYRLMRRLFFGPSAASN